MPLLLAGCAEEDAGNEDVGEEEAVGEGENDTPGFTGAWTALAVGVALVGFAAMRRR